MSEDTKSAVRPADGLTSERIQEIQQEVLAAAREVNDRSLAEQVNLRDKFLDEHGVFDSSVPDLSAGPNVLKFVANLAGATPDQHKYRSNDPAHYEAFGRYFELWQRIAGEASYLRSMFLTGPGRAPAYMPFDNESAVNCRAHLERIISLWQAAERQAALCGPQLRVHLMGWNPDYLPSR